MKWYHYFKRETDTCDTDSQRKTDLYTQEQRDHLIELIRKTTGENVCPVSAATGEGMPGIERIAGKKTSGRLWKQNDHR